VLIRSLPIGEAKIDSAYETQCVRAS